MDEDDLSGARPTFESADKAAARIRDLTGPANRLGEQMAAQRASMDAAMESVWAVKRAENQTEGQRIDREKRALELTEQLADAQNELSRTQADLLEVQRAQVEDARHDRRIQYAVLAVAVLTLAVTVVMIFA